MDTRSEAWLAHVHPLIGKVMRATAQAPQPFTIVYGLRTLVAEAQACASGHSTTMHSRHLADPRYGGVAMAVDVAALVDGEPNFAPGHEARVFGEIAAQVKAAAHAAGVVLEWGGDWTTFKDWGHFQLPWSAYP